MCQADISTKSKEKTGWKATSRKGIWSGAVFDLVLASTPVFLRKETADWNFPNCLDWLQFWTCTFATSLFPLERIMISTWRPTAMNTARGLCSWNQFWSNWHWAWFEKNKRLKKLNLQSQTEPLQSKISAITANPNSAPFKNKKETHVFHWKLCSVCYASKVPSSSTSQSLPAFATWFRGQEKDLSLLIKEGVTLRQQDGISQQEKTPTGP